MAKPKSVYLTDRSMSALRPGDSLSARMNQIVDRYLQLMEGFQFELRQQFTDDQWERVCATYRLANAEGRPIVDVCDAMIASIASKENPDLADLDLAQQLDMLNIGELAGLYDLIEAEPVVVTPTGQS